MHTFSRILILLCAAVMTACSTQGATNTQDSASTPVETNKKPVAKATFDADSAYAFVEAQVAFGPRVPNTQAHAACADWLVAKLNQYGAANVVDQHATLQAYNGTKLNARNISGQFNPNANKRVLLLSHWDSRPWADHDPDPAMRNRPIDGANDGASGVGVILEIARQLSMAEPGIGVDVLFVDAEDYGTRADDAQTVDDEDSWCLGTQYWTANPTVDLNYINYAILLDMVGGKDAVFPREYFSEHYCREVNDRVWRSAQESGFGSRFADVTGIPVVDDHIPLLRAGIPAIDIIETMHPKTQGFNPTWHTQADNMDNIDRETLRAVGQTLLNLIY